LTLADPVSKVDMRKIKYFCLFYVP
jgi:hypothetical protein